MSSIPYLGLLLALFLSLASARCTVCGRCIGCAPDVLSDIYIDDIDGLLQSKIEMLGYLVHVNRRATAEEINYEMVYSGGLLIKLALELPSLQIQLLNYSITGQQESHTQFAQPVTPPASAVSPNSPSNTRPTPTSIPTLHQTTSDGYQIINDFASERVREVMGFLEQSLSERLTNFQLRRVQVSPNGNNYRLHFEVLPISTQLISVTQIVTLNRSTAGFTLVDSSYADLPPRPFHKVDVRLIAQDPWASKINEMLLKQYASQLGATSLTELSKAEPYYMLVYRVGNIHFKFVLLYDYFQRRIIEGNVTQTEVTTNSRSTQTATTSSSSSSQSNPSISREWETVNEYQRDKQAAEAVIFLSSFGQLAKLRKISSMERRFNGTHILYEVTAQIDSIGGVSLGEKIVFFRYSIAFDVRRSQYVLEEAVYVSLPQPSFQLLSIQQIRNDRNIIEVAKYLLTQQTDRLEASSRVISVSRDLPYYRLTFLTSLKKQLTYVILLNIDGAVSIIDIAVEGDTTPNSHTTTSTINRNSQSTVLSSSQSRQSSTEPSSTTTTTATRTNTDIPNETTATFNEDSSFQTAATSSAVSYAGSTYQRAPTSVQSSQLIQLYLMFIAQSGLGYSAQNLLGIYTNPLVPNSLLFQFREGSRVQSILTTTREVQRLVTTYYRGQGQGDNQNQIISSPQPTLVPIVERNSSLTVENTQSEPTESVTSSQGQTVEFTRIKESNQSAQLVQGGESIQSTSSNQQSPSSSPISQTVSVTTAPHHRTVNADTNCLCYQEERCLRCAHRYFLKNNQCHLISSSCLSFDIHSGTCLGCVPGYELSQQGECRLEVVTAYYFENQCLSCYGNERLINNRCVAVAQTDPSIPNYKHFKNPLCLSWEGKKCIECYPGTFLSKRGLCQMLDPFCAIFEYVGQSCEKCESGYQLKDGKCYQI